MSNERPVHVSLAERKVIIKINAAVSKKVWNVDSAEFCSADDKQVWARLGHPVLSAGR